MSLTKEELKLIGGSDAAKILGESPYGSAIDVFNRIVHGEDTSVDTRATRRGTAMEPVIRALSAEEFGFTLKGPRSIRLKEHPWLRASLDDVHQAEEEEVVEFKSVSSRVAHTYGEGPDDIPTQHICQSQFYMAAANMNVCNLVAFIGGDELRRYRLIADHGFQEMMFDACARFWRDHVLTGRPPPPDGSKTYSDWLNSYFTNKRPEFVIADERATAIALEYRALSEAAKEQDKKIELLEQQLKEIIDEASGLEGPFGRISFKRNKDTTKVDWQGLAANLNVPQELMQKYTTVKPGPRVFRPTWRKAE